MILLDPKNHTQKRLLEAKHRCLFNGRLFIWCNQNKVFDDDGGAAACASKQVVSTFQLLTSSAAKWQVTLYYTYI